MGKLKRFLNQLVGKIGFRLLLINVIVILVPVAGLEFAKLYEQSFLDALEQDMRHQAVLVRHTAEAELSQSKTLATSLLKNMLGHSGIKNLTWIRVLDENGQTVLDPNQNTSTFGPRFIQEPPPTPAPLLPRSSSNSKPTNKPWAPISERSEVQAALLGNQGAMTRILKEPPAVVLMITEPIIVNDKVRGVVYVAKTTNSVLLQLYRVRSGLYQWFLIAIALTVLATLVLAFSISRPLSKLAKIAERIASGSGSTRAPSKETKEPQIPIEGSGEVRTLAESFSKMTEKLQKQVAYTTDYAANVAHEFKSPLTSIRGAAELLQEGAMDDPEARKTFLTNIENDAERLNLLVTRLLELSRIEASSERSDIIDLHTMLSKLADRMQSPDNPITVTSPQVVSPIVGRRADLETALINLIDNALRYSPAHCPVEITLRELNHESSPLKKKSVAVEIRDYGPGIHQSYMGKLFTRFFTTAKDEGGTGLGLSIVKSVIAAHEGKATADNAPNGSGSVFTVILPI